MADTSQTTGGDEQAAAASSSEDSRAHGVQARPFQTPASALLAFFCASHARPVSLLLCPADVALGVAGVAALIKRAERMLLGEGKRPVASGMGPAAPAATNGLVLDLRSAVSTLWGAHMDAIKAACAPHVPTGRVDEMDVLAWLTADALDHPLLHADDTNLAGKRVDTHATRVKSKLKEMDAAARKAVGKAKTAAGRKPELLPKVAAAEASGEKARAAYLEKPYDPQLPAPRRGTKRPEACRREAALTEVRVRARKAVARVNVAFAELQQARVRCDRVMNEDGSTWSAADLGRAAAVNAAEDAARVEFDEAYAAVQQAGAEEQDAMAALAELADESDGEEAWAWDPCGSAFEMFLELQHMTCAVAMAAAGHAHCAHCAHLMVRHAESLTTDPPPGVAPPRRSLDNSEAFDRFLSAWQRSRVLDDTTISAQAWAAAEDAAPLCAECGSCCELCRTAGTLTAAGEAAAEEAAAAAVEPDAIAWSMCRAEARAAKKSRCSDAPVCGRGASS